MTRSVKQYYTANVKAEWARLGSDPYHKLELDTTLAFLWKYLPRRGLILDAGGGPGRYAIELAKAGYEVVLLDLSSANLAFAKKQVRKERVGLRVRELLQGSVTDLSAFSDNTFDAVVCLGGPLSHVLAESDRNRAIQELARVAKDRAPVFISVMSRLSVLASELKYFQDEIELPTFRKIRDSGDYLGGRGFTACHFFLPEEFRNALLESKMLEVTEMVGLEGIGSNHREAVNKLAKNQRRWKVWLETHQETATHPSVVGTSEHILAICRKARLEKSLQKGF
jgi:ubiquinone/menaquinone biosynthesis C-methylase UbiE